jgi:hypothetical protein
VSKIAAVMTPNRRALAAVDTKKARLSEEREFVGAAKGASLGAATPDWNFAIAPEGSG